MLKQVGLTIGAAAMVAMLSIPALAQAPGDTSKGGLPPPIPPASSPAGARCQQFSADTRDAEILLGNDTLVIARQAQALRQAQLEIAESRKRFTELRKQIAAQQSLSTAPNDAKK